MKRFKILNDNLSYPLTVNKFEQVTKKGYPYYNHKIKNGKIKHLAICPMCNNPIQIINLYNKNIITKGRQVKTYAKHYPKTVPDLVNYTKINYVNCPLRSTVSFDSKNKHTDKSKSNEIILLINEYPEKIKSFLQKISGINFSKNKILKILEQFKMEEGYYFNYVTKFNLPYSILYMSDKQDLCWQYIKVDNENLINAINQTSEYFLVNNSNQILPKEDDIYTNIYSYFTNFKFSKNDLPQMTMIVEESLKDVTNELYRNIINIDIEYFWNSIQKI